MRRHYKPLSSAARDARSDAKRAADEAAGIQMRDDADFRTAVFLDLRGAGGPNLVGAPCRGKIAWRLTDADTSAPVDRGAIKELLHRVADRLTPMRSFRNT